MARRCWVSVAIHGGGRAPRARAVEPVPRRAARANSSTGVHGRHRPSERADVLPDGFRGWFRFRSRDARRMGRQRRSANDARRMVAAPHVAVRAWRPAAPADGPRRAGHGGPARGTARRSSGNRHRLRGIGSRGKRREPDRRSHGDQRRRVRRNLRGLRHVRGVGDLGIAPAVARDGSADGHQGARAERRDLSLVQRSDR